MLSSKAFRRGLLAGAAFALSAIAGGALAQSAPTTLLVNTSTANGSPMTSTGSCTAPAVVTASVMNDVNRTITSVVDNIGNTYTGATDRTAGAFHTRLFTSTISTSINTSTTFTVTLSAGGTPHTIVTCEPSGTGVDTEAGTAATGASSLSTTSSTPAADAQMIAAVFLSNRWTNATPQPPTGWTLIPSADTTGGGTFGVKMYYAPVAAGANLGLALSSLSATTYNVAFRGVNYSAATIRHNLTTTKAGD